jgi:hypothetical protein
VVNPALSFIADEKEPTVIGSLDFLKYLRCHPFLCLKSEPSMHQSAKSCADTDLRSLLKHQHKTVYSICRLFARTYKEHQHLFTNIIAAASQNIRSRKDGTDKQTMLWRACVNMAALHSIGMEEEATPGMEFKSPDYQRSMSELGEAIGNASDYDKFLLFIGFEKISSGDLFGPVQRPAPAATKTAHFIPYLKEKLVWN